MARILLTSKPPNLEDLGPNAFAVVAKGASMVPPNLPVVDVEDLIRSPQRLDTECVMVTVGLSRILTPSNRVRLGQVLLRPRPTVRRISVDDVLFVSEPWRAWWHFFATRTAYRDFTDSFIAESKFRAAHENRTSDPFSLDEIVRWGRGHIQATGPFRFDPIFETVVPMPASVHEDYAVIKEDAFTQEKSVSAIIRRLSGFASSVLPERQVPTTSAIFRGRSVQITRTDLAVDVYLASVIRHAVDLTNGIAEAFGE